MSKIHPAVGYHDQLANEWKDKYQAGLFNQRAAEIAAHLSSVAAKGQHWLDAGCGSGVLTAQMIELGLKVNAVDASKEMIYEARKTFSSVADDNLILDVIETVEKMKFSNEYFDGILCSSVIEYVDNPIACFQEFNRVLKPGGHLVITVPNKTSWIRMVQGVIFQATRITGSPRPAYLQYSKNHYNKNSFLNVLKKSKFDNMKSEFIGNRPQFIHSKWTGALMLAIAKKR